MNTHLDNLDFEGRQEQGICWYRLENPTDDFCKGCFGIRRYKGCNMRLGYQAELELQGKIHGEVKGIEKKVEVK